MFCPLPLPYGPAPCRSLLSRTGTLPGLPGGEGPSPLGGGETRRYRSLAPPTSPAPRAGGTTKGWSGGRVRVSA